MTQYSANPIKKEKPVAPKKGSLITYKEFNSPFFFFKIAGGGTIPAQLAGGWMSQKDADQAQAKYEANKRPLKPGEKRQESEVITSVDQVKNLKVVPPVSIAGE